jgi:hypothetical protein
MEREKKHAKSTLKWIQKKHVSFRMTNYYENNCKKKYYENN